MVSLIAFSEQEAPLTGADVKMSYLYKVFQPSQLKNLITFLTSKTIWLLVLAVSSEFGGKSGTSVSVKKKFRMSPRFY